MDKKHVGARNELRATVWLLEQGYEVFRNVSAHGIMDVIAIQGDELLRIDVKAGVQGQAEAQYLSDEQIAAGVLALVVYPDGTCIFRESRRQRVEKTHCKGCGDALFASKRFRSYCSQVCSRDYRARMASELAGAMAGGAT